MAQEQYLITCHDNEWKISFNGRLYGPYESRDAAIEAAIEVAQAMGDIGIHAHVAVQDADASVQTAWASLRPSTRITRRRSA